MISGIGLYLKLCLDYHRLGIQNQLSLAFGRCFTEHLRTIKTTFIASSVFSGFSIPKEKTKKCTENPRKFIVGGNWKMNATKYDIKKFICKLKKSNLDQDIEIVVAVPSVYLQHAKKYTGKNIHIAAQNCYKTTEDGITGELTANMLQELDIEWVILGDSCRRIIFKESDELVGEKVEDALCDGVRAIVCLVETKEDIKKKGKEQEAILRQLKAIGDAVRDWCEIILAYEPVWTSEIEMTPKKLQAVHCEIRQWLKENVDEKVAEKTRIIYAGKIDGDNAEQFAQQKDVDGFLLGEKSLSQEFIDIISSIKKKNRRGPCLQDHSNGNGNEEKEDKVECP